MKFNYPDMITVAFNGMRFYETPTGKYYPSITTVLGGTMSEEKTKALTNWRNSLGAEKADKHTQRAADRGTAVHLMAERYLKKEDLIQGDKFNPADISSFNSLKLKLNKITEVYGQEVALCSDILEVAGRCDVIGIYNGKESIIDFKTSDRLKSKKEVEDYNLQLLFYALSHNEMFGTDIDTGVILMTSAGGFPQEFIVNLLDYVDPLVTRIDEFYKKLTLTIKE